MLFLNNKSHCLLSKFQVFKSFLLSFFLLKLPCVKSNYSFLTMSGVLPLDDKIFLRAQVQNVAMSFTSQPPMSELSPPQKC